MPSFAALIGPSNCASAALYKRSFQNLQRCCKSHVKSLNATWVSKRNGCDLCTDKRPRRREGTSIVVKIQQCIMKDEESWYATDTLHISRQWTAEEASSQDSSSVSLLTTANSFLLQATNSINSFFLLLLHNHVSTVLIHAEAVIVCFCRWLNPVKIAPRKQWIPNRALPTLYFIFSLKLSSVKIAEEGRVHLSFSTLPSRRCRRPSGHDCGPTSRTKRVGGWGSAK